jgi:hypothetical protein
MNRRGFFASFLAAAVVAAASSTRLGQTALAIADEYDPVEIGRAYTDHLIRSMIETKETLAANILNRAFEEDARHRMIDGRMVLMV